MRLKKALYTIMAVGMITTSVFSMYTIKASALTKEEYMAMGEDEKNATVLSEVDTATEAYDAGEITPDECKAIYDAVGGWCSDFSPFQESRDEADIYLCLYPGCGMDYFLNHDNEKNISRQYLLVDYLASVLNSGTITPKQCNKIINGRNIADHTMDENMEYAKKKVADYAKKNHKSVVYLDMSQMYDFSKIFDAKYYAARYPFLAKQGITSDADLLKHFETTGMEHKYQGNAEFNFDNYLFNNQDLPYSFGSENFMWYIHYMTTGYKENRIH